MTTRVLIDTDPGQDDAVAILLALACPELSVEALFAVAGNMPLEVTTANARRVLDLAGREDIPAYAGAAGPLLVSAETVPHISGPDGLLGHALPPPSRPAEGEHGAVALARMAPGTTLCALGPLTNVALALALRPGLPVTEILWMGGSVGLGNMTAAAEFNAYADPHAAAMVLASGLPLRIFALNVTQDAVPAPEELDRLRAGGACARAVGAWMGRPRSSMGARGTGLYAWHDPCVIAALVWPDLFTYRDCHVHVATEPGPLRGRTTVDWQNRSGLPSNARVAETIDARGFFARVTERLLSLR